MVIKLDDQPRACPVPPWSTPTTFWRCHASDSFAW